MFKKQFVAKVFGETESIPLKGSFVGLSEISPDSKIDDNSVGQIIYRLDDPRDLRLLANLLESWKDFTKI